MGGFDDRLFQFGPFVADPVAGNLHRDGTAVPLSLKTFEVLIVLLEHRGTVMEKDVLLKLIWRETVVEENTLARHISTLRKALNDDPQHHHYIRTVPGRGYRFAAPVRELTRADLAAPPPDAPPSSRSEPVPSTNDAAQDLPGSTAPRGYVRILIGGAAALSIVIATLLFLASPTLPRESPERRLWQFASSGGLDDDARWDPTGQSIAYASDRGGNLDIWTQSTRDDRAVRLTSSAAHDWQPSWSPDGRFVVFRSERDGGGLFIVPSAGGA